MLGTPVAIKCVEAVLSTDAALDALLAEATTRSGLQHPHLVQQLGVSFDQKKRCELIMELMMCNLGVHLSHQVAMPAPAISVPLLLCLT